MPDTSSSSPFAISLPPGSFPWLLVACLTFVLGRVGADNPIAAGPPCQTVPAPAAVDSVADAVLGPHAGR